MDLNWFNNSGNYSWEAMPQDGDAGYNYQWEYRPSGGNWSQVSTSKIYSRYVTTNGQDFNLRVTVTSGTEQDTATINVVVTSGDCTGFDC